MNVETIASQAITVDYGMSLEDMIAAGNYDWIVGIITAEKFIVEGAGVVQFEPKTFDFDQWISATDAIETIKADDRRHPWEPAKIEHLLAYGARSPEEQLRYAIIALGSTTRTHGGRSVPFLDQLRGKRRLGIEWRDDGWDGRCRFLAVRNIISST